jgi:hypothetical protein
MIHKTEKRVAYENRELAKAANSISHAHLRLQPYAALASATAAVVAIAIALLT